MARLPRDMADRDRQMQTLYRDRGAVKPHRFAARCARQPMIGLAMNTNAAAVELDEAMGAIVRVREFPVLTNNASLDEFE